MLVRVCLVIFRATIVKVPNTICRLFASYHAAGRLLDSDCYGQDYQCQKNQYFCLFDHCRTICPIPIRQRTENTQNAINRYSQNNISLNSEFKKLSLCNIFEYTYCDAFISSSDYISMQLLNEKQGELRTYKAKKNSNAIILKRSCFTAK